MYERIIAKIRVKMKEKANIYINIALTGKGTAKWTQP